MWYRKAFVPILLVAVVSAIVGFKLLFPITTITNVSAVENARFIGVYWDENCEDAVYTLDWGELSPGATRIVDVYVRNEGNESIILDVKTENWSPLIAARYISLSSDYDGHPIQENQVIPIKLVLSVSPKIKEVMSFSFDVSITGNNYGFGFNQLWDRVINAPEGTVYFIYADPNRMTRAVATYDVASGRTIYGMCSNTQNEIFDNDSNFVEQTKEKRGKLLITDGVALFFGGPAPHRSVSYYENAGLTPVKFYYEKLDNTFNFVTQSIDNTFDYITKRSEVLASLPANTDFEHEDMFVIEVFEDTNNNLIFISYGFNWKGTWASGKYIHDVLQHQSTSLTNNYYIYHWIDVNGDGIPQSNEIAPE